MPDLKLSRVDSLADAPINDAPISLENIFVINNKIIIIPNLVYLL